MYGLALKRRLSLAISGDFNPFVDRAHDDSLSPSLRNRAGAANAEMALTWSQWTGTAPEWQREAREKLAELITWQRLQSGVKVKAQNAITFNGQSRDRFVLSGFPGSDLSVDVLWPEEPKARNPVMICLQGTNSGAHLSWGEALFPPDPIKIASGLDIATQAIAHGFIAVCIEQSCFGVRRETVMTRQTADPCIDAANHSLLLGHTLVGDRASDVSAVIDWLTTGSQQLGVDSDHIYILGTSSAGTTALYSMACDIRLAGGILCGCLSPLRSTVGVSPAGSGQAIVPGILRWFELSDVLALAAPRPVVALSGLRDHIYPFAATKDVVDCARSVYQAMNSENNLLAIAGDGGHRFYPDLAWPAFEKLTSKA